MGDRFGLISSQNHFYGPTSFTRFLLVSYHLANLWPLRSGRSVRRGPQVRCKQDFGSPPVIVYARRGHTNISEAKPAIFFTKRESHWNWVLTKIWVLNHHCPYRLIFILILRMQLLRRDSVFFFAYLRTQFLPPTRALCTRHWCKKVNRIWLFVNYFRSFFGRIGIT